MNLQIKNNTRLQFLLLILFNILFFILAVYSLPIKFDTNDDAAMCLIASGAFTGTPETHLVFINIVYGFVLAFFYKIYNGIEWYTVFFSIIHIISLSITVYFFIKSNKSKLFNIISICLIYVLELTTIQNLQFTTTAAFASFAGTLLLFKKKNIYNISGTILFIIGTLIRFPSGMLVMLLMLPCFLYKYLLDKRKNKKEIIFVIICICSGFIFHLIDKQAYKVKDWFYYSQYNATRGYLLGNPNRRKIINDLPNDITINDYNLFLEHFIDGKHLDLTKLIELKKLVENIPQIEKNKNILTFINKNKLILLLIIITFALLFFHNRNHFKSLYILSYFVFLFIILLLISRDGIISHRVFISIFFPIVFFLYNNVPPSVISKNYIYILIFVLFNFYFIYTLYNSKIRLNNNTKFIRNEQGMILEKVKKEEIKIIGFKSDLLIEYLCSPFNIYKYFKDISLFGSGWFTNIPYNKGYFDSYLSIPDEDISLFIYNSHIPYITLIQYALIENYAADTEIQIIAKTDNYSLIRFIRK